MKKNIKNYTIVTIILISLGFISYIIWFNISYSNSSKMLKANIEIERLRLENAIKIYKNKNGNNPQLIGNEDNLENVKENDTNYSFGLIYGNDKIYEIPENLSKNIVKSNKITNRKDNKGGWVYNIETGKIEANIE